MHCILGVCLNDASLTYRRMTMAATKRLQGYSAGPAPTTDRGQRRHAGRSDAQKAHAKRVWEGGYTKVVDVKKGEKRG